MNFKNVTLLLFGIVGLSAFLSSKLSKKKAERPSSLYELHLKTLDGKEVDMATLKGRKLLIVNTASKCGKTPQYADLEKLHERMGNKVTVLGFPANNFLWQEPGSNEEIAAFCERNYGVKFQMFEKLSVKGSDQHPLYQWLEEKTGERPDWNFSKYLVNEDGTRVKFFKSGVNPLDPAILEEINK